MEQTLLTNRQRAALDVIRTDKEISGLFYLTGGTVLAEYYLRHRYSEDLDLFTDQQEFPQLAVERIAQEIKTAIGAEKIEYKRLYDRRIFFFKQSDGAELKIEFTLYPFTRLRDPLIVNGLRVDSFEDAAANKVMALLDRIEPKDFVDLFFILKKISVDELASLANKKFDFTLDPVSLGSEFAKVRTITMVPKMVQPLTLEELRQFYTDLARSLKPRILEE